MVVRLTLFLVIYNTMVDKQKSSKLSQGKKRPFDIEAWEADMKFLASLAEVPTLPPFAFTRESIYNNHD